MPRNDRPSRSGHMNVNRQLVAMEADEAAPAPARPRTEAAAYPGVSAPVRPRRGSPPGRSASGEARRQVDAMIASERRRKYRMRPPTTSSSGR